MQGRKVSIMCVCVVLLAVLNIATVQASSSHDGTISLLNPFNPAERGVSKAVDRTLLMGSRMNHAGSMDSFSSWSFFTDYETGKNDDKRAGGFDNYFNSYTVGADAFYNDSTLWGLMFNYVDEQGSNGAGASDEIDTMAVTLYMSRAISDTLFWGTSFTYSNAESYIRNGGTTDSDSYVIAPYMTMVSQMDSVTLSLSPSYVLAYQDVEYPGVIANTDDRALMGKLLIMGRASCPVSDKMTLSGNLDFNQVLHNHGLDTEIDNDHQWFTTGVNVSYVFTDNVNGSIGYTSGFDSDFNSEIWSLGLNCAF